jgi:hypothetical protein
MSGKTKGEVGLNPGHGALSSAELLAALAVPFPQSLVSWVVIATRQGKRGKQGLVVPYADPRAYTDRLNGLVTAAGWTREYVVEVAHGFERKKKGVDPALRAAKVLVVCKVTIFNLGTHSGTGESWADDENAMTAAEAQAFKRSCSCFGLGRYLYDVTGCWVELNEQDRPTSYPDLPTWAKPRSGSAQRSETPRGHSDSAAGKSQGAAAGSRPAPQSTSAGDRGAGQSSSDSTASAEHGNGQALVSDIRRLQALVGQKLSAKIVLAATGVQDIASVTDAGKIAVLYERLVNASRGVERLKKAVAASGLERYSQVCAEIGFSGGLGDVPDTKVLRTLVERMEAVPAQQSVVQ